MKQIHIFTDSLRNYKSLLSLSSGICKSIIVSDEAYHLWLILCLPASGYYTIYRSFT